MFQLYELTITWPTKKQPTLTFSSTSGEYQTIIENTEESLWLQSLIR
jgi:hypothetical protein